MTEPETGWTGAEEPQQIVEPLSATDKFVGILSEPAATFVNVRDAGSKASDWMLPLIALVVVIMAGTLIRFSDPEYKAMMQEQQQKAMQEQVASGKMTQQQADQIEEQMQGFGDVQRIISAVGIAIGVPFVFFLLALFYWVIVKFLLKGDITFGNLLGVYGLTAWIGVIDQLVGILLGFATGNFFASLSAALFIAPDVQSSLWKALNMLNPISIWSYVLFAMGLVVVARISKTAAYGVVFGLWLVYFLGVAFVKLPFMG